jgi:hypothetical protein
MHRWFRIFVSFSFLIPFGVPAGAQEPPPEDGPWSFEGELGASVFFGNTDQTTVSSRAATTRADSTYEFESDASFIYSEATGETGNAFVAKRSWDVQTGLDYHPYARVSPFVFGTGESSFERRIAFRYQAGAGAKLTMIRNERSRVDLSGAVLAEQTWVRDGPGDPDGLARLSTRLRGRRAFSDGRPTLQTVNFYRPALDDFGNFVFESESSLGYDLTSVVTLKVSFKDTYDSEAVERGADTNNDGQILFSVLRSF